MPSIPFLHSIRGRLVLLVFTAIAVSTLTVGGLALWQATASYATQKRDTLYSTANVLAAAAARGVAERDLRAIHESIRAIGRIDTITYVAVSDAQNRHMADLGATEQLVGDLVLSGEGADVSLTALLASRSIELAVPIIRAGETVGSLMLLASTSDLWPRLRGAALTTLAGSLVALILGLAVAARMQSAITRPIAALSGAMRRVSEAHDFTVNVASGHKGEVGLLANGFNAMLADIRERDERLAAHREHLESEVAARTTDLVAARDLAEDANAQKSRFLATMSHEIRTPMNGMLVMAELLASSELPSRARRYAEVVSRSGQSLLAIINDILDFSKIEAGKLELEKLAVDPTECAETVVSLFLERARAKGLDLAARVDLEIPATIEADPVRLGQVLGNLVNNALKFTKEGGVEIRVARDPADPLAVTFAVVDTGVGIPADKLDTVFEAFSQVDKSTTRRHGGTGLGLAICQRLVNAMGGEITVTSELGRGSTFAFAFRCLAEGAAPPEFPKHRARDGERPRAIIVSRRPLGSATLRYYVGHCGYEVTTEISVAREADFAILDAGLLDGKAPRSGKPAAFTVVLAEIGDPAADRCLANGLADMTLPAPPARGEILALLSSLARGEAPRLAAQTPAAEVQRQYRGARVLVADDSAVNREVAIEALGRFGVTPDTVEDGQQAVEACAARDYDLVLMDGSMPVLDGFEAARRIRAGDAARGRHTPIVALTAHVIGAGADEWRDSGMDGVLHKPFSMARLGEALALHLKERASATVEGPVVDPAALDNLRGQGAPGFANRVIGLYRDHAPKAAAEIAKWFGAGDLQALASAAHALKSMSLTIGAARVAATAAEIEKIAKADGMAPPRTLVDRLPGEISEACEALTAAPLAA